MCIIATQLINKIVCGYREEREDINEYRTTFDRSLTPPQRVY
jgi:hypothetical protein